MIPAVLIFAGILAFGTCQFRINESGVTRFDVAGATFGCGLIVAGFSMIAGA